MTEKKYILLREEVQTTVNTSAFPASANAVKTALDGKVSVEEGKGLSTNDYTDAEQTKLSGIATGAQVNVLEGIQFNGTDATITSKKVNITPTAIGAASASHTHGNADLQTGIDAAKIASVSGSKLPMEVIPKAAVFDLVVVANKAARLALTSDDVQKGDVVKENDTGLMYFVVDEEKLGTEDAFEAFKAGEASSVEWANVKNKVNASASAAGILTAADWQTFNGKQDEITSDNKLGADLVSETSTRKFVTPTEKDTWSGKQDAITSDSKLSSDLVDDTGKTHKFVTAAQITSWEGHVTSTSNPHQVTKAQVGLGNCDNTSDLNKPISTATQTALDGKIAKGDGSIVAIGHDTTGFYIEE